MASRVFVIMLCFIKVSQQDYEAGLSVTTDAATCTTTYKQCSVVLTGSSLSSGPMGSKGEKGYMGEKGDMGASGMPGASGVCECNDPTKPKTFLQNIPSSVTVVPDGNRICLNYDVENVMLESTLRRVGVNYSDKEKKFWYSQYPFNIQDLYGLSMSELRYISDSSIMVTQKLRYFCYNSFNLRNNSDTHVRLLSWNHVVVGSEPTDLTPFYYNISYITDGCKGENNSREVKHTDIELSGSASLRLPIVDIQIRDARHQEQVFYVEPVQLCFII